MVVVVVVVRIIIFIINIVVMHSGSQFAGIVVAPTEPKNVGATCRVLIRRWLPMLPTFLSTPAQSAVASRALCGLPFCVTSRSCGLKSTVTRG